MKPAVKVFTKDNPVTKLDLWNCFRGHRGFINIQVDTAKSLIGENSPRYLTSKGYLGVVERKNVEYYSLTTAGAKWLLDGFKRYLKNHPLDRKKAKHLPNTL
jgi:hypothetical protein